MLWAQFSFQRTLPTPQLGGGRPKPENGVTVEGLVEGTLTGGMPKATEGVAETGLRVGRAGGSL